eukprot:SAG31_NODE_1491_length_8133_cov_8.084267_3_plen_84_part_00
MQSAGETGVNAIPKVQAGLPIGGVREMLLRAATAQSIGAIISIVVESFMVAGGGVLGGAGGRSVRVLGGSARARARSLARRTI